MSIKRYITGRKIMTSLKRIGYERISNYSDYHFMVNEKTKKAISIRVNQEIIDPVLLDIILNDTELTWKDLYPEDEYSQN